MESAPPQYSPDGQWWWTGRRWVPAEQPAPTWDAGGWAPAEWTATGWRSDDQRVRAWGADASGAGYRRRRSPAVLWIGLLALLALLFLATGGAITTWIASQGFQLGIPTAPAPPAATPDTGSGSGSGSASGSGSDSGQGTAGDALGGYRQVVTAGLTAFQAAAENVGSSCAAPALATGTADCRQALVSMDDAVRQFQTSLDATPVPGCVQPADRELRNALDLYHEGIDQELQGLDQRDVTAVARGAATLREATGHARTAGSLLPSTC